MELVVRSLKKDSPFGARPFKYETKEQEKVGGGQQDTGSAQTLLLSLSGECG